MNNERTNSGPISKEEKIAYEATKVTEVKSIQFIIAAMSFMKIIYLLVTGRVKVVSAVFLLISLDSIFAPDRAANITPITIKYCPIKL